MQSMWKGDTDTLLFTYYSISINAMDVWGGIFPPYPSSEDTNQGVVPRNTHTNVLYP